MINESTKIMYKVIGVCTILVVCAVLVALLLKGLR